SERATRGVWVFRGFSAGGEQFVRKFCCTMQMANPGNCKLHLERAFHAVWTLGARRNFSCTLHMRDCKSVHFARFFFGSGNEFSQMLGKSRFLQTYSVVQPPLRGCESF